MESCLLSVNVILIIATIIYYALRISNYKTGYKKVVAYNFYVIQTVCNGWKTTSSVITSSSKVFAGIFLYIIKYLRYFFVI